MDVRVQGEGPIRPFEAARSRFEAVHDLEKPVTIEVETDPDVRTKVSHDRAGHTLTISEPVARSSLAMELAVHEFAHMRLVEQHHPSHTVNVREAFFLASAGYRLDRTTLMHAYQIANHLRDIYADDVTFDVTSGEKFAGLFESELATAIADSPRTSPAGGYRLSAAADPPLTVVNAAFALALLDRNDISTDHRLWELAHAAETDAPAVNVERFKRQFSGLTSAPSENECLRSLVDLFEAYFESRSETTDQV